MRTKNNYKIFCVPFFVATIVFIITMLEADAIAEPEEWSRKLYGHFFPIMQDGATSLSMKIDLWKFTLEFLIFYFLFLTIFLVFKIKFKKWINVLILILFFVMLSGFITIISIDIYFAKIDYAFNYTTLKSMWF